MLPRVVTHLNTRLAKGNNRLREYLYLVQSFSALSLTLLFMFCIYCTMYLNSICQCVLCSSVLRKTGGGGALELYRVNYYLLIFKTIKEEKRQSELFLYYYNIIIIVILLEGRGGATFESSK